MKTSFIRVNMASEIPWTWMTGCPILSSISYRVSMADITTRLSMSSPITARSFRTTADSMLVSAVWVSADCSSWLALWTQIHIWPTAAMADFFTPGAGYSIISKTSLKDCSKYGKNAALYKRGKIWYTILKIYAGALQLFSE